MQTSSSSVIIKLPLPRRDYRVFLAARRILIRVMGDKAPDTIRLIQNNLTERDAIGLADEYLDAVGWPMKAGRTVNTARGGKASLITPAIVAGAPARLKLTRQRGVVDPARN